MAGRILPPTTAPAQTEAGKRKESARIHRRNAHRREAILGNRNVEFIKLDPTDEERQKMEEQNALANSNAMAVIQPLDPTTPDLYTPGTYKTDPDLGFHIFHDKNGNVRPLRDRSIWFEGIFDTNNAKQLELEHGSVIDYVVRGSGCSSVTYNFPADPHHPNRPPRVDQRVLRAGMKAALERGVGFEFGPGTIAGINAWPKKERELWYKFKDDVNAHAKKRQLLMGINGKSYKKYADELNGKDKLNLSEDNAELSKKLFPKASANTKNATKEQVDELEQVIASAQTRASTLKQKQEEVRSKLNSMEQVLNDPNFLETRITMPKNWGNTHSDNALQSIKDLASGNLKKTAAAPFRLVFYHLLPAVLPVIGALPYLTHRAIASRTKEARHGSLDPDGVVTKMQDGWNAASSDVEALITATQKENADLAKRQELIELEIGRLNTALAAGAAVAADPAVAAANKATLQREVEELDRKLGEKDPAERAKLETTIAELTDKIANPDPDPAAVAERAKLAAERNINDSELNEKQGLNDTAQAELSGLQNELSDLQNKLIHAKSDLINMDRAVPPVDPVVKAAKQAEKAELETKITDKTQEIQQLEPEVRARSQEIAALQQQKAQLDLRDPVTLLEAAKAKLGDPSLARDPERKAAEKEYNDKRGELAAAPADAKTNKDMTDKVAELKTKKDELKTAVAENDTVIKELEAKKNNMAQKIAESRNRAQVRPK